MTTEDEHDTTLTPCDVCGELLGDEEPHLPHPDDCNQRYGEELCACAAVLEVHDRCCFDCHPELEPSETQRALRRARFLPPLEDLVKIPELYVTEAVGAADKTVHLHFVAPGGEWWIVERDRLTNLAFGYACLNDPQNAEWGYVDLTELEALKLTITLSTPSGIPWPVTSVVERDTSWRPRPAVNCDLPGIR